MKYLLEREEIYKFKIENNTERLLKRLGDFLQEKYKLQNPPSFNLLVSFAVKYYLSQKNVEILED